MSINRKLHALKRFAIAHKSNAAVLLFFTALGVLYWYPLSVHLGSNFYDPRFGDSSFNMWILGWGNHALTHAPWRFFEAPMFYPYHHVLAWGDHLFSLSLVTLPLVPILGLIATYNAVLVGSSILCGYTLYVLANYLTKNRTAAIVAGTAWMFSNARIAQAYLQLLPLWWLPLVFYIAEKIRHKEWHHSQWWLSIVLFLQITTGIYVAIYTVLCFALYLAGLMLFRKISKPHILQLTKAWVVAGIAAAPVYIPSIILNLARPTIRGLSEQSSLQLSSYNPLHAPGYLWGKLVHVLGQTQLSTADYSLGVVVSVVAIATLVYLIIQLVRRRGFAKLPMLPTIFMGIGSFAFLTSLGPNITIGVHSLRNPFFIIPYLLVPGFKVMRLTLRWQFIALFAFSLLTGFVLARLFRNRATWQQLLVGGVIIVSIIVEQWAGGHVGTSKALKLSDAPVYQWLSKQPEDAIIAELPIYPGVYYGPNDVVEGRRLYFQSLSGWHRRASGAYSPFIPQGYAGRAGSLNGIGENPDALKTLRELHVSYIVFLPQDYVDLGWGKEAALAKQKELNAAPYLKKVVNTSSGSVYQLLP